MDLLLDLPLPADGALMTVGAACFIGLAVLVFGVLSQARKPTPTRGNASWWDAESSGEAE